MTDAANDPRWALGVWATPGAFQAWQVSLLRAALHGLGWLRRLDLAERAETWLALRCGMPGHDDPPAFAGVADKTPVAVRFASVDDGGFADEMHLWRRKKSRWARWWLSEIILNSSDDGASVSDGRNR